MNVLFVAPLPTPITGQSLACRVLLDDLTTHHRVDVVDLTKRDFRQGISSLKRIGEIAGVLWQTAQRRRWWDVLYLTVSESVTGNLKDICIYLLCAGRLSRVVIHVHGGAGMTRVMRARSNPRRWVNRFFFRRLGAVIVLGPTHAKVLESTVSPARLHVVPNFAVDALFADRKTIDAKFQDARPLRVLFLSNLLPGKGHVELVEAFRLLDEPTRKRMTVDFVGGFETESQKGEFLRGIEGIPQLRYHGILDGDHKTELFHRAHVFCLPTYYPYEGQPISILEAYASGCAVITTNHSGIPDIFADSVNGYEVAIQSAPSLKGALERCVDRVKDLHAMAVTNRAVADRDYRASMFNANVSRIIESVGL
jgi:glycosyltransferase involved in cell wall biosynthesis